MSAVVQSAAGVQTTTGSVPGLTGSHTLLFVTLPQSVTKGNLIVVVITNQGAGLAAPIVAPYTPFDNFGSTYLSAVQTSDSGQTTYAGIFYTLAPQSGTLTVDIDAEPFLSNTWTNITVYEVVGYDTLDATGTGDLAGFGFISGVRPMSVLTSGSTQNASEFALAVFQASDGANIPADLTWTAQAGTDATQRIDNLSAQGKPQISTFTEAFVLSSKGQVTATATCTESPSPGTGEPFGQLMLVATFAKGPLGAPITGPLGAGPGGGFPSPEYGYGYGLEASKPAPAPKFYNGQWSLGRNVPGGPVFNSGGNK